MTCKVIAGIFALANRVRSKPAISEVASAWIFMNIGRFIFKCYFSIGTSY